jgi:hypothetical protein
MVRCGCSAWGSFIVAMIPMFGGIGYIVYKSTDFSCLESLVGWNSTCGGNCTSQKLECW